MTRRRGFFLTFEGVDGSGKSTQIGLLYSRLKEEGYPVVVTVEPGGTAIGSQIRRILLDPQNQALSPRAELLLYFASRAQNVDQFILPALKQGKIVLCDRFTDSTIVYQGKGRGLGEQMVSDLHSIACRGLTPDLTLYLDMDLKTSLERARSRNRSLSRKQALETRMDEQSEQFYRRVRRGYRGLAHRYPKRFRIIDARRSVEEVCVEIWCAVHEALRVRK